MIASQKIGKSFMDALGYNLKKVNHSDRRLRAEVLESNFVSLEKKFIALEIEQIRQLRPALNKYVYHTSLNFLKDEEAGLTNDKLLAIAKDYLTGMGFTNNQYIIFRHHDAEHPHIHILANRITPDGHVVSDSNNFRRSEALLRKLECEYDLTPVRQSKYAAMKDARRKPVVYRTHNRYKRAPKKDELEMVVRKNQPSGKMLLQEKLSLILQQKRSMQDFIRQCRAEGIFLLFNQASTGYISGITYFLDDFKAKGQALGDPFKWA